VYTANFAYKTYGTPAQGDLFLVWLRVIAEAGCGLIHSGDGGLG